MFRKPLTILGAVAILAVPHMSQAQPVPAPVSKPRPAANAPLGPGLAGLVAATALILVAGALVRPN